jgi:hypothetical protein
MSIRLRMAGKMTGLKTRKPPWWRLSEIYVAP